MLIIADDLTGAADAGVAFAEEHRPVRLMFRPPLAPQRESAAAATAIDTASRDANAAIARREFTTLLGALATDDEIFNKVDSMLRGHIRLQIETLYEWFPDHAIVVAPAFPRVGRFTRRGVQYIHDLPLHRAGMWAVERIAPPRSVPDLLGRLPHKRVELAAVRLGGAALLTAFDPGKNAQSVLVCDAETDQDLDNIVWAGRHCTRQVVWVGSGGLAAALARDYRRRSERPAVRLATTGGPAGPRRSCGPCLTVVGSAADAARRQAHALATSRGASLLELPSDLLASADNAALSAVGQCLLGHASSGDVVVTLRGPFARDCAVAIQSSLAAAVAPVVNCASVVILVGGSTARAIVDAWGIGFLELVRELEPGVVLAHASGAAHVDVITKAGAFGDDFTLIRALQSTGY